MTGLIDVPRLLVIVTVCAALEVSTLCAANANEAGAKVSGRTAVPFTSSTCWPTAALSEITTAPLMAPLCPDPGENVTPKVQVPALARTRFAEQGFVPLPAAEKSPLDVMLTRVNEVAPLFLTVRVFAVLLVAIA